MALSKALDEKVKNEIGFASIDNSNGITVLSKLEDELGLVQESKLGTIDLLTALNRTKKDPGVPSTIQACSKGVPSQQRHAIQR